MWFSSATLLALPAVCLSTLLFYPQIVFCRSSNNQGSSTKKISAEGANLVAATINLLGEVLSLCSPRGNAIKYCFNNHSFFWRRVFGQMPKFRRNFWSFQNLMRSFLSNALLIFWPFWPNWLIFSHTQKIQFNDRKKETKTVVCMWRRYDFNLVPVSFQHNGVFVFFRKHVNCVALIVLFILKSFQFEFLQFVLLSTGSLTILPSVLFLLVGVFRESTLLGEEMQACSVTVATVTLQVRKNAVLVPAPTHMFVWNSMVTWILLGATRK